MRMRSNHNLAIRLFVVPLVYQEMMRLGPFQSVDIGTNERLQIVDNLPAKAPEEADGVDGR